jgi:hypothetical protein
MLKPRESIAKSPTIEAMSFLLKPSKSVTNITLKEKLFCCRFALTPIYFVVDICCFVDSTLPFPAIYCIFVFAPKNIGVTNAKTTHPKKKMFQAMADALFELIYQRRHLWEEKTNTDCVSKLAV